MSVQPTRILIVDDDRALLRLLRKWMETSGFAVECARDGQQAVASIKSNCPQILITDRDIPRLDGIELCRWLRQQPLPSHVYTIVVTTHHSSDEMLEAFEAGADDFLKKPIEKAELVARVQSGLRMLELEAKLNALARTDSLTGLANRRTFFELAEREWGRAHRHHIRLSAVMIDIDYFKSINDTFGHRVGDQALRVVAKVLQENCRGSDILGRYGGEEFCVLLPETDESQAAIWAERVRERLRDARELVPGVDQTLTASFGVAQRGTHTNDPDQLIDFADQALLIAKRTGRDRVVRFQSLAASTRPPADANGPESAFDGLTARHVMTPIVAAVNEDDTVGRAAHCFARSHVNSAPVVNRDGKLVGILSKRDVMSNMIQPGWPETKIQAVMERNVVFYEESTPVVSIHEFLRRVPLRRLVVVKEGHPTGLISRLNFLHWFTSRLAMATGSAVDVSALEPSSPSSDRLSPHENATMISRALVREAEELTFRLERGGDGLVPTIVGGVARMEELLDDLLAFSGPTSVAGRAATDETSSEPAVGTLTGLPVSSEREADGASSTRPSAWLPGDLSAR